MIKPGVSALLLLVVTTTVTYANWEAHPCRASLGELVPVSESALAGEGIPVPLWTQEIKFRPSEIDLEDLTKAERYMLGGARMANGTVEQPWISKINMFLLSHYGLHGELPTSLTQEMLDELVGNAEQMPESMSMWYRSPITGQFPRFDSPEFAPGGVYARVLSREEVQRLAVHDSMLAGLITVRKLPAGKDGAMIDAQKLGPVLYFRYFGETGLLKESYTYAFAPTAWGPASE